MPSAIPRGRFVWHELLTSDSDGATSFYTKLIGWGTQVWEGGPSPHRMWMNGETAVGGVLQLPDEAKQQGALPHWLAYVATPDVNQVTKDAEARAVAQLGNSVQNGLVHGRPLPRDLQGADVVSIDLVERRVLGRAHVASVVMPPSAVHPLLSACQRSV